MKTRSSYAATRGPGTQNGVIRRSYEGEKLQEIRSVENSKNSPPADEVTALAQILNEAIPSDKARQHAYRVLAYLANETIRLGPQSPDGVRIPTKAIHSDLGLAPNQDPSRWVSTLWKDAIIPKAYPSLEATLIRRCQEAGFSRYPGVGKIEGSPAYYFIEARDVPKSEDVEGPVPTSHSDLPAGAIRYEPDLTLQLSRRGRLIFSHGLVWSSWKRYSMLAWQMTLIVLAAVLTSGIWIILSQSAKPLSAQDILLMVFCMGVPWGLHRYLMGSWRLFDDRIAIAPDWMLQWAEQGATVEIIRSTDPEEPSTIRVVRYTTKCPVCSAMVKLDNGEPDFPQRIVGRCAESPREHIFSFDRITRTGEVLRRPPIIPQPR